MTPTSQHIFRRALCAGTVLCGLASASAALELDFPGTAELVAHDVTDRGAHPFAVGPFSDGQVPNRMADGAVQEFVWQITGDAIAPDLLLNTLTAQLNDQGFDIGFTCAAANCGGFDFRYALPVGNAPDMHVDLGNFHYLFATNAGSSGTEHVALMISQGGARGFVHMALVQQGDLGGAEAPTGITQSTRTPDTVDEAGFIGTPSRPGDLVGQLVDLGAAALDDLQFEPGASALNGTRYASLEALADFLGNDAARRVVLVGHTDATGSLVANIALSLERAQAVRRFLINDLGVAPEQVRAEGVGYLAPRASNATVAGREANRRVEVVLTDAQ